jgi:hypothetical protein
MLCLRFETIWLNVIHLTMHFLCSKLSVANAGKNWKLTHFNTHFSHRTTDVYSSYIASRIGDKRSTTYFLIFFPLILFSFRQTDSRLRRRHSFSLLLPQSNNQFIILPTLCPCLFFVFFTSHLLPYAPDLAEIRATRLE